SFQPLRSDAVHLASLASWSTTAEAQRIEADKKCLACHAAPAHHGNAKADEVHTCAACHRDHEGRDANIVRPTDAECIRCHASIATHRTGGSIAGDSIKEVTHFGSPPASGPAPHPDFRSLASDPGNIKFNHWLHMQPGVAARDAKHKLALDDLPESW